jgi:hypothetical protein
MKRLGSLAILALLTALASPAPGQEKPAAPEYAAHAVILKVSVVFNEYEGDKKISSLPYTLFLKSEERKSYSSRVRMGVRVPIWVGGKDSEIQYQDIGSNIDCNAQPEGDGRYVLDLNVERSSIYSEPSVKDEPLVDQKQDRQSHQPLVRTFRASYSLLLRDGQTTEGTFATDPLNGHVIKVDVTLGVMK